MPTDLPKSLHLRLHLRIIESIESLASNFTHLAIAIKRNTTLVDPQSA